jgi:integrase
VADFHALRHTFITELVRAGVAPKGAKKLARHSTITLTMDCYARVGIRDTAAAVARWHGTSRPEGDRDGRPEQHGSSSRRYQRGAIGND